MNHKELKKVMDILLLNPPKTSRLVHGSYEQFKDVDIGIYPPLGLMYIAAYLTKYSPFKVEILDAVCERLNYKNLEAEIRRRHPHVVGIYTSTFTIFDSYKVAQLVKTIDKGIKVMLGGPHVELYPDETIRLPAVDYLVIGEGEQSVAELLNCLSKSGRLSSVRGIGYKENGRIFFTPGRPMIANLDEIPFPARELTNYEKYYSFIGSNRIATTIMSSRGCPHRCAFCYVPYQGTLRLRSTENVLKEIEKCLRLGIREFFFFDENFTVNRKFVLDLCNHIIDRKMDITFYIRSRIDTIDEEMLVKLKLAGCLRIQFGVESGSPRILKAMNKQITLERIQHTFDLMHKVGIPVYADFMLGYPGEAEDEMKETIAFAKKLNPDFVQYGVTMYLPKTKIYEEALKNGILKEDIWKKVAKDPVMDISYPIASREYSREALEKIQRRAYIGFYFRPQFVLKRLINISSLTELKRQLKAAFFLWRGSR